MLSIRRESKYYIGLKNIYWITHSKYCIGLKKNIGLYIKYFQFFFFVGQRHIVQNQIQN
jgi:hypothetical protein